MKTLHSLCSNRKPQRTLLGGVTFVSLFMLMAVAFTACDKSNPLAVDKQPETWEQQEPAEKLPEITVSLENLEFSFNGKHVTKENFKNVLEVNPSLIMVAGAGLPDTNVVYAFDSENGFNDWAKTTQFADKFAQMNQQTSNAGAAKILGAGGWAQLYDGNLTAPGPYWYSPALVPWLGSFNDRTSSVVVYAGKYGTTCALYEHINYGGRRLYLTANPGVLAKFSQSVFVFLSFDNTASAVFVY